MCSLSDWLSVQLTGAPECAPCLSGCLSPLCLPSSTPGWLPVPSVCTVESAPVCMEGKEAGHRGHRKADRKGEHAEGHTEVLLTVHTEGTGNQPGVGEAGHRGHRKSDR